MWKPDPRIAGQWLLPLLWLPMLAMAQVQAPLTCNDPTSSMLWEISGEGGMVNLFGSIHVGKPDFYPLPATVSAAFEAAEFLVFEVDPSSATDPGVILQMQQRGMLPAGQSLRDIVSVDVLEDLERVLEDIGLPSQQFMNMQPWLLTLVLTSFQMSMQGYQPQFGIESYLSGRASENMEILELESIQQQLSFLEQLNAESFLAYTLEGFDESAQEIESLMRAWRCADKDVLYEYLFNDFNEDPSAMADMAELREKLFYERNRSMTGVIRDYIDNGEGDYFVVVGSGHLLGEGSIIDLLQDQGYTVNPVALDSAR